MQSSRDGSTWGLSSPNITKPALLSAEPELLVQLGHLLLTRRPKHWTKQEDYVPMNIRDFRYSCCWSSTWEERLCALDLFPQRHVSSTVWYIGHSARMGTALGASDIRTELEGRISSGWGGDFVQEAASKNLLPGSLLKAQGGRENQDVGLGQGSSYSWKWIWVGWDGGRCFGTSHLEFVALFFLSPFISSLVGCLGAFCGFCGFFGFGGFVWVLYLLFL